MKRLLAFIAFPVVLAAGLVGLSGARQSAAAAPRSGSGCILGIICFPGGSSSPAPGSSSPAPAPSPTSAGASPTADPSGGPGPSPTAGPASSPASAPSPGSGPPCGPTAPGSPSASGSAAPGQRKAAAKRAAVTGGLVASEAGSVLTAGSATRTGFAYQGNVDMPVAGGGTVTMMKFTADSITLAGGVTDFVFNDTATTVTTSPTLAFSGGVTLYATRLSG